MTEDTKNIKVIRATKAIKVPGALDNATGKRKKKELNLAVQTGPRRLFPKKMVTNNTKVEVPVEQLEWIWECTADKPREEDITQKTHDSTSAGHIVEERRFLKDVIALLQPTCFRHKKKKAKSTKHGRLKVMATPSEEDNEVSETTLKNLKDHIQGKENSDHDAYVDAIGDNKEEDNNSHKEHERNNGECEDKDRKQKPDNALVVNQDQQRKMEGERNKRLGRRLQRDLEKGLRMQKNLHMKLHSQLKLQKDLEVMKAILTELEKGLKLQKVVENELRLRKELEDGLDESKLPDAKGCAENTEATRAPPLSVDIQAPEA
ncbi:hypothetical protein BGZ47_006636 [Haplosporangium gracile]|nr:hypothetical protein BGZ47_006636 [Haplosporangium gracile]